ncbi:MAG: IS630 family transposase, partial [Pseudomonadota bacterium]|nr:IS630 family transposase [Pseudomonadota bacterium]
MSALGPTDSDQPLRLFCQDESRIGLHLPLGRRLTAPGVKPLQSHAPLYEYFWLYAAVEPHSGESCWLELPRLDTICFQAFLDHFSAQFPDSFNLLVLDNAPAHVAKALQVPDNVALIDLPPYCPELNPIERLWQDLKRRL